MPPELGNAGPPITELWAWIVTDAAGREAMASFLFIAPACGPDLDRVGAPAVEVDVRARYHGLKVELRRFVLAD